MIELPESKVLEKQMNQVLKGKTIRRVTANAAPHKFAFYYGDPEAYSGLLTGKTIDQATAIAGFVEVQAGNKRLLFGEGVNIRYLQPNQNIPEKHQLLLELEAEKEPSFIVCTVQMYGSLWAYTNGENDNPYYQVALEKPSPLSREFDEHYFSQLMGAASGKLSVKAFLATEQRIPGLGNGVLQDILFHAGINPRTKLHSLSSEQTTALFRSVKETLAEMTQAGGRDTEKDLYGQKGGYQTQLSSKTLHHPCPACGHEIMRQAYLGGTVYFCPVCQPLP